MTKEKMKWKSEQDRWQKDYKRRTLYITPRNLGGTCREDTVVLANRWFEEQKARIDAEDGIKRLRPHEPEHREELDKLQAEIKRLSALLLDPALRPIATPVIELSKNKVAKIQKKLCEPKLVALKDSLRSPLSLSEKEIEDQAEIEAFESQFTQMWEEYERNKCSDEWMACNDLYRYHHYAKTEFDDLMATVKASFSLGQSAGILSESCRDYLEDAKSKLLPPKNEEEHKRLVETVVDVKNFFEIRFKVQSQFIERRSIVKRKKRKLGVIDDYSRGILSQRLDDGRLFVPETKKLSDHIDKFVAFQETRHKSRKIKAGQMGQIVEYMKLYRKWTEENGVKSVDAVGTKEHVDAYFDFILEKVQRNEISPGYGKKWFATFKRFVWFLIDEKTLSFLPPWEGRRDDKYAFKIEAKEPKILSLAEIRAIYEAAPLRVKLFTLLVMNCGFGQGEIGRLKNSEYDPVKGTIKHKRIKTDEHKKVPKVTYRLWDRTKQLLDQQIEAQKKYPLHKEHRHLLLLNESGKPLWSERFEKGKHIKSDNITCQFKKFIAEQRKKDSDFPECTFYMFRRTASTLIYNSEDFSNLDWLFLGHAPNTTAGQHYSVALESKLDSCLKWLEGEFFGRPEDGAVQ